MADEQNTQGTSTDAEAQKKVNVPEAAASEQDKAREDAANARGEYLRMLEKNKDLAVKYGQPDFPSLLARVGSDSTFAVQLVQDLVSDEQTMFVGVHPDAPQEKNITGTVDHTEAVAKKLAGTVAENLPPSAGVNTNAAPTPEAA